MYHDIEREPVSLFLREVRQKKLSGHLFVNAKDFQITLNLLDGKLANGQSTHFDEKLPVILHQMGMISEEQYSFLSGLQQFSDDQVAGILLDQNFAKKKDIYYARVFQLRRIAISTFTLLRGVWIFTAGEPDPPLREVFEIPLEGILVEGARSIEHATPYAGRWLAAVPAPFNEIPMDMEVYFTDAERELFAALRALGPLGGDTQARPSCRQLISRLGMAPLEFWRGMLAFHLMGIVEFEPGTEEPDLSADIAALLELNQRLLAAEPGDPVALGLPPRASREALERAATGLLSRFAPEHFGANAAPEVRKIAREVCRQLRILAQGPELPGEAEWRQPMPPEPQRPAKPEPPRAAPQEAARPAKPEPPRAAPQEKARPAMPEPPPPVPEEAPPAEDEEEFELSAEFAVDEPEGGEPELVLDERDRLELTPVPGAEAPATQSVFFEEAVPPSAAPAAETPVNPVEWILEPDISGVPEPTVPAPPPASPPPFAPVAAPPALHMVDADHEKAWELLIQAKELYEKHDYPGAVPLLKKAIKLEPKQGDFYYLLGLCQSEAALTKNEAEINLKKAIELKSWSADPVYALGVLYRGQGKMKLAERCFTRVKEIAYEHTGASRALVDLRRQKAGKPPLAPARKKH